MGDDPQGAGAGHAGLTTTAHSARWVCDQLHRSGVAQRETTRRSAFAKGGKEAPPEGAIVRRNPAPEGGQSRREVARVDTPFR